MTSFPLSPGYLKSVTFPSHKTSTRDGEVVKFSGIHAYYHHMNACLGSESQSHDVVRS